MKKKDISILTLRNVEDWPSFQIVYEWEDVLCSYLKFELIQFYPDKKSYKIRSLKGLSFFFYHKLKPVQKNKFKIYFQMAPSRLSQKIFGLIKLNLNLNNNSQTIPIIIDFYLKEKDLPSFYRVYNKVPFLLITSAEAYSFLQSNNCPLRIYHFPLSLPDKYKLDMNVRFEKKYNLALIGRSNPLFKKWLDLYSKKNPNFIYLVQKEIDGVLYYVTNKGETIGCFQSREEYIELLRSTKVAFYSTPGIDTIENSTNQVTPRLYELMSAQCLILARYPDNEDTRYYELEKTIPNITDFEMFENLLNQYLLSEDYPMMEYAIFLSKHYTSLRAAQLLDILKQNNIDEE